MKKKDLTELEDKFRKNLFVVKQNLSEHLSAINENTSELQALFDYIHELEQKIEKLAERIDQLQLQNNLPNDNTYISPLNNTEKKIFLVFYTEEDFLSCLVLSQKSGVPLSIIREHLTSLINKGIPLSRSFQNNQTLYRLDPKFKEWQAKENILNLSLESFSENKQAKLKTYLP